MSQTFLIIRRNERDVIKMCTGFHIKYRYSCQILTYFDFLDTFSENSQISQSIKISPVEAELFHADREIEKER
jgi:predicted HD phosphohydrolase